MIYIYQTITGIAGDERRKREVSFSLSEVWEIGHLLLLLSDLSTAYCIALEATDVVKMNDLE